MSRTLSTWSKRPKMSTKVLILTPKMNVRLVYLNFPWCSIYLASSATELSISGAASLASVAGAGLASRVRVGEMASGVTLSRDGASLIVGGGPSKYIVVPSTTYNTGLFLNLYLM